MEVAGVVSQAPEQNKANHCVTSASICCMQSLINATCILPLMPPASCCVRCMKVYTPACDGTWQYATCAYQASGGHSRSSPPSCLHHAPHVGMLIALDATAAPTTNAASDANPSSCPSPAPPLLPSYPCCHNHTQAQHKHSTSTASNPPSRTFPEYPSPT
jgi:hypothetical protein